MSDDTVLGILDEVEDIFDFLAHRYLLGYFDHSIFEAEVGSVYQTISIGDVAQYAFADIDALEHVAIHTVIASRIATEDDVGRYVLLYTAAALDEREATNAHVLLYDYTATLYRAVFDDTVAGNAYANTKYALVVDLDVMTDVYLVHKEIAIANDCSRFGICTTSDHDIFADTVVITNDDVSGVAFFVVEILWCSANHGILIDHITTAHHCTTKDAGVRFDDTIVADDYIILDVSKGTYFYVISNLCTRVHVC